MAQTIKVTCPKCDKTIKAGEKYWGKKVKCPGCAKTLKVPSSQSSSSGGSASASRKQSTSTQRRRKPKHKAPEAMPAEPIDLVGFDDDVSDPWDVSEKDMQHYDDGTDTFKDDVYESRGDSHKTERERPRPRKKKRQKKQRGSGIAGGVILSGIGMMAGAVVWFFGALFFMDVIFFYPPILFIFGLVTLVKGLLGDET